ncbi:MAG: FG-GAP repeat domain-containing protein [Planctomycetota bacterium]
MIKPLAFLLGIVVSVPAAGQPAYLTSPDWESLNPHYSTGAALVDLDRDGWLDLVVADGNDIEVGRLNVYYNDGAGTLPTAASWQSSDLAYNGHLDVADVDGDGWLDVAVAILVNEGGPAAKLYLNSFGTLSSTPDWTSAEAAPAFGVAFGDTDNDGRPDLAVATGWAYGTPHLDYNYVYHNVGGMLESSASWQSDDTYDHQGALWTDADDDGWLDLVLIAARAETRIYRNLGGVLETTASWETADSPNQDGIMVAVGDVTGDGRRDLLATDNTQLSGSGRFKQYTGLAGGSFSTTYSWNYYEGYGSAVALADVNADGALDLATGAWWDYTRIFYNTGFGLSPAPSWNSGGTSVVEKIVFGDVDPACGVELAFTAPFPADGGRRLFYLPHQPVQGIVAVRRDGVALGPHEFTYSRESGWISVNIAPSTALEVDYTYSHSLDMAISNWDGSLGNYLYYNLLFDDCNRNGIPDGCDIDSGFAVDVNHNGVPDGCEGYCPWDLDESGDVGVTDFLQLLAAWGTDPGGPPDFDGDGDVGVNDFLILLANWGPCP